MHPMRLSIGCIDGWMDAVYTRTELKHEFEMRTSNIELNELFALKWVIIMSKYKYKINASENRENQAHREEQEHQ